jgi:hypothetical protein
MEGTKNKTKKGRQVACLFFYGVILKCPLTIESEMCNCERFDGWGWGWGWSWGEAGRVLGRLCCLRKNNLIDT